MTAVTTGPRPVGDPPAGEDARARFFAAAPAAEGGAAPDLRVRLGSLTLRNPVMPASGCFGPELAPLVPTSEIGATVTKTVFARRRGGNPTHRLTETPMGMINSVGIPSLGTDGFVREMLPRYRAMAAPVIVSVGGLAVGEYLTVMDELAGARFDGVEVNVSCPNLEHGGLDIGTDPDAVARVVSGVVARTDVPVLVKLTPMVSSIAEVARAAEEAGATALTVANSFPGMTLDPRTRRPVLGNRVGGVSGPAVKPLALRLTWATAEAVGVPVIGCGGISTVDDALDFLAVGATAVQVGTAHFARPFVMAEIARGLAARCAAADATRLTDYVRTLGET
ncbi:dihydroorotate dehydrogenase [Actinoalloteichus caeruleus]|uniref:dihydroorotate dehydrogenase n=1 Tax=Actinoalloteichus cyanogriseus TaxID=2893586 RepID=UPI003BB99B1B